MERAEKDELEAQKDGGYSDYEVTYDVVTDRDRWFTLKLTLCQIMGSGSVDCRSLRALSAARISNKTPLRRT